MISTIISEYEIDYLKRLTAPFEIEDHAIALDLDIAVINKALSICREKIQEPLWALNLCFIEEDIEAIGEFVQQIQGFQTAYSILEAYKNGLEKAISESQHLQAQKQKEIPLILK